MNDADSVQELVNSFLESPEPSFKVSNYFKIYNELFSHLRGKKCTFIETGVLNGGSLFMWKRWLGEDARIIGIDLNPEAKKWEDFGFEIFIGDQGDPSFWRDTFSKIGPFDALLDDGGHQSFQQIVTLVEAVKAATTKCTIAIEDTCTSFLKEFSRHFDHSFLEYAKDSTDILLAKHQHFYEGQFPRPGNPKIINQFSSIESINFFPGIVAYKIDPTNNDTHDLCWNRPLQESGATDFRYHGTNSAKIDWPNLFTEQEVVLNGGEN